MKSAGRVLVLDGDQASTYAIVRSLARRGLEVHVADDSPGPLAGFSRHVTRVHRHPSPDRDEAAFVRWVIDTVTADEFAMVLPVTDRTIMPLAERRDEIAAHTKLAIAPAGALELCADKIATFRLARELDVPVPGRLDVTSPEQLDDLPFEFPVVVKPARSRTGGDGRPRRSFSVRYAHDAAELDKLVRDFLEFTPVVVQEYVSGAGVGVEVLVDRGEIVAAFQHRRLHEWPLTGGGSSYRESVPVDPELLEDARRLMRGCEYHGVAMVEFKKDAATDRHWLMEINGRFWGSLALCVHAGADFPAWLHDLEVHGRRPEDVTYRHGIRARKFSRDLFWAIEVLRRSDPDPLIDWPPRSCGITTWFEILRFGHRFDVQNLLDPRPGLIDLSRSFGLLRKRILEKRNRDRWLERMRALRRDREGLRRRAATAGEILFVCYGNINRSPLAGIDLLARPEWAGETPKVTSAGLHDVGDRPADPRMTAIAAEEGLDLRSSRSSVVDRTMMDRADLVIAMDLQHVIHLEERFPGCEDKILLHGVFAEAEGEIEIKDPYGGSEAVYRHCFERVRGANDGLIALLPGSGEGASAG